LIDRGRLLRPSQDSRHRYGCGLVFNQIDALSSDDYREHAVRRFLPGQLGHSWLGIHTYNACGEWAAIDILK
jgi:hypothetical protein